MDVEKIAQKLGTAQTRVILSLSLGWGPSGDNAAAKRIWYRGDIPRLIDHKHRTDDCWCLTQTGLAVRAYLKDQAND